jgi:enediyne biosynthesis protein E4
MLRFLYYILIITLFSNCRNGEKPLFQALTAKESGIDFKNQLIYTDSLTVLEFEYMFNGAGVGLIDVNNDGLQDIFFAGNMVSCRLYLNKGNLKFEDITEKAGLKTVGWNYGVSIVDINNDGFKDIYVCKAGYRKTPPDQMQNQFFINNGNNTFTDKAAEMGLNEDGYDIQTAFFDYDKDGDLDMYLLKNAFVNYNRNNSRPKEITGKAASTDKLYRNNGNMTFTDVSKETGITYEGFGLGVSICDLNEDDYPDIYVSNDFLTNDLVYINNKNGTFTNKAHDLLKHETYNGMGNDVADYNNDGHSDIMVLDMLPQDNFRWKMTMMGNNYDEFQQNMSFGYEPQYVRNTLQLNNGDGSFSEIGQLAGVHATDWSWSPLFADYDNDGKKDLMIANGYRQDVTNLDFIIYGKRTLFMGSPEANRKDRLDELKKLPGIKLHNFMYQNNGDLTFKDVSEKWGFSTPTFSNGAAYADLDNDGDLDMIFNNLDSESQIYENKSNQINPKTAYLRFGLQGNTPNRDGFGAKIWLWQRDSLQFQYFSPVRGYLSTVEPFVHFGLLQGAVDSMKIRWADGKEQLIKNPKPNQCLILKQNEAINPQNPPKNKPNTLLFQECANDFKINYQHQEDEYVDFKTQPLLQTMHSRLGPSLAVGDINGDGLEDFYAGAGAGFKGQLFIQQKNNTFSSKNLPETNASDDMGALLFDADKDEDLDLYIVSGGSSLKKNNDPIYQHRLYVNDGNGNYTRAALPASVNSSGSSIVAADYDKDGDLDLFVGGRVSSGEYPIAPKSFLLQNESEKGSIKFLDITPKELSQIGMVTSALWTDFDNDGWVDLVLVGEFMPITFIKNEAGKLNPNPQSTIPNSSGWWNSLVAGDFDKDGDIDYIAGNLGLNTQWKASTKEPVCVYGKDYDKNGRIDPLICHYVDGVEQMFHARDDINKQMTPMRGRFRDYSSYAKTPFKEAFREDELSDAYILRCEKLASTYIENLGNGKFVTRDLPLSAQISPIFGMLCDDFDGDGNLDVLSVGNSFSTEVNAGRYDAQGSLLLKGDGKGHFVADRKQLNLGGDNKSIVQLTTNNNTSLILVGSNTEKLKIFKHKNATATKNIPSQASYALITGINGKQYKQEFYYGNSYLSQSSRKVKIDAKVFDFRSREIHFPPSTSRK